MAPSPSRSRPRPRGHASIRRVRGALLRRPLAALVLVSVVGTIFYAQRDRWLPAVAATLVCEPSLASADAIVIDNVVPNYALFERTQQVQKEGVATLVLVPIPEVPGDPTPRTVSLGMMDLMCGIAKVASCTPIPADGQEPISLTVAGDVAREIERRGAHSIVLVTSELRSRRTDEAYRKVLAPLGIRIDCQPVPGGSTVDNWYTTTHGVQDVVLQLGKLWYYRLVVLP